MTELILTHLEKLGIDLKWLRGQGYDNGANMKGVRKGVQNRILEKYPRAFYVPCACHSLNLVVNDAATTSTDTTAFFSIVQELYTFFSGSTKRWEVLKKVCHTFNSQTIECYKVVKQNRCIKTFTISTL